LAGVPDPDRMTFIAPEHLQNAIDGSCLAELNRIDANDFVQQLVARKAEFAIEQGMEIETANATGVSVGVFVGPLLCSQHGSRSHEELLEAADPAPAPAPAQQAAASGKETEVDKVGSCELHQDMCACVFPVTSSLIKSLCQQTSVLATCIPMQGASLLQAKKADGVACSQSNYPKADKVVTTDSCQLCVLLCRQTRPSTR
jgi:hypothetical protein